MSVDEITALPVRDLSDNLDVDAHLYLWTVNAYLRDAFDVARAWGFHHSATIIWCKDTIGTGLGGVWPTNAEFVLYCRRPKITTRLDALEVTSYLWQAAARSGRTLEDVNEHMGTGRMAMWWVSKTPTMCAVPSWEKWCRLKAFLGAGDEMDGIVHELNDQKGARTAPPLTRAPSSWFQWKRGEHSRKPDAFLDLVETVSPGPYLELFARRQRLGWDTWGNEALDHTDGALSGNAETRTPVGVPDSDQGCAQ